MSSPGGGAFHTMWHFAAGVSPPPGLRWLTLHPVRVLGVTSMRKDRKKTVVLGQGGVSVQSMQSTKKGHRQVGLEGFGGLEAGVLMMFPNCNPPVVVHVVRNASFLGGRPVGKGSSGAGPACTWADAQCIGDCPWVGEASESDGDRLWIEKRTQWPVKSGCMPILSVLEK